MTPRQEEFPLFTERSRIDWTLTGALTHWTNGRLDVTFTRCTLEPFQIQSTHVGQFPASWLAESGRYPTFRAAMLWVANDKEVAHQLHAERWDALQRAARRGVVDGYESEK